MQRLFFTDLVDDVTHPCESPWFGCQSEITKNKCSCHQALAAGEYERLVHVRVFVSIKDDANQFAEMPVRTLS